MNCSLECRSLFGLVPLSPQPFLFGPFNCFGLMGGLEHPGREEGKRKIADGRTDGWQRRPKSGEIPREGRTDG